MPQLARRSTLNQAGVEESRVSSSYKQPREVPGERWVRIEFGRKGEHEKEGRMEVKRGREEGEEEEQERGRVVCAGRQGWHHKGWPQVLSDHAEFKHFLGTEASIPWLRQGQVNPLGTTTVTLLQLFHWQHCCLEGHSRAGDKRNHLHAGFDLRISGRHGYLWQFAPLAGFLDSSAAS